MIWGYSVRRNPAYLLILGMIFILSALGLAGYNLYFDASAGESSRTVVEELEAEVLSNNDVIFEEAAYTVSAETKNYDPHLPQIEYTYMPIKIIKGIEYCGIVWIPSIDLELPIADNWDYTKMKSSPIRYYGSAYMNDLVVCAHNNKSQFGNIKELNNGDEVVIVDAEGRVFKYEVQKIETVQKTSVEYVTHSEYDLALVTCTIGGGARVAVFCNRPSA